MEIEGGCIPAFESSPMKVLGQQMPAFEDIMTQEAEDVVDECEGSGISLQPSLKQYTGGSPPRVRGGSPARDLRGDETVGRRDWMPPPSPPASPPPESDELQESEIEAAADYDDLLNEKQSLLAQVLELTENNETLRINNSLLTQKAEGLSAALDAEKQLNSHNNHTTPPSRTQSDQSIHIEYMQQIEQMKKAASKLSTDLDEALRRESSLNEVVTNVSLQCEELTTKVDELRALNATKDATVSEMRLELLRKEQMIQSQKTTLTRLQMEKIELVRTLKAVGGKDASDPITEKRSPTKADLKQLLEAGEELSRANRDAEKKLAPSPSVSVVVPQPAASRVSVPLTFNCTSPSTQAVLSDSRSDSRPTMAIRGKSPQHRTPSPNTPEVRFTTQQRSIIPPGHPYAPRE